MTVSVEVSYSRVSGAPPLLPLGLYLCVIGISSDLCNRIHVNRKKAVERRRWAGRQKLASSKPDNDHTFISLSLMSMYHEN